MAYELNPKIRNLTPYEPIHGNYRIRLDANESFLQPPQELCALMAQEASRVAFNRYPDPYAKRLCRAFADYYHISPENVTAGNGSDELISVILSAFLMKGGKVLTLQPDFSMYHFYSALMECHDVIVHKTDHFHVEIDELIFHANQEKCGLIIFSNPCNPTSVGVAADDIRKLLHSTDALIVLDEAYMDFWDQSLLHETEKYDNLIILRTCSKAIGLAALRVGFAVACRKLTAALRAVKSPYNVNSVSQAMAAVVFEHPSYLKEALQSILHARDALYHGICSLETEFPGALQTVRPATNFVFLRVAKASELFLYLKAQGIVVRQMGDYLRITAGAQEENQAFLKAMHDFLEMESGK